MRRLTKDQIEASRRKADKYFPAPASAPAACRKAVLTDDMRIIARYLFGAPMASVFGNVERSHAIDALARLSGTSYEQLADDFDARRVATAAAHDLVRDKYPPPAKRSRRGR